MQKLPLKDKIAISEHDAASIMQKMLCGEKKSPDDLGYHASSRTGARVAVNIDTLVQSTDMPQCMTLRQAARKSMVSCASDFAAKGQNPKIAAVSVNMPYGTTRADVTDIARGFADAASEYGIRIVAGDTNAGKEFVFSVCMTSAHPATVTAASAATVSAVKSSPLKVHIPRRGGARMGDKIFVTGPFGYTALGLDALLHDGSISKRSAVVRKAITYVLMPSIRMEFGIKGSRYFTSAMDSSDGLASTLNEMARQSMHDFKLHTMPTTEELITYARRNCKSIERMVFEGGEEYEIVFTTPADKAFNIQKIAKRLRVPLIEIGEVGEKAGREETCAVTYQRDGLGDCTIIKDSGWDHFNSARVRHV